MSATKLKTLAIISDCVHQFDEDGNAATENHIYCKQMQAIASEFAHTFICCPFKKNKPNDVRSKYELNSIEFIPLPNVGGNSLKEKLNIIKAIPIWVRAFRKANEAADIIYIRFPNNLSIIGFFYFYFKKAKTFAQYTGTWKNYSAEPLTYRFQKWLLKKYFKGPVWVYTDEDLSEKNLFKGSSPSYSNSEWNQETENIKNKVCQYQNERITLPVFITVGSLVAYKNQQVILDAFKLLLENGVKFILYIVGDGPLMNGYKQFIEKNKMQQNIFLTGKKSPDELKILYHKCNFLVQAPLAEGFGKVPVEGFYHGVIPLLSNTAMAKSMVGNNERGFIFDATQPSALVEVIIKLLSKQELLPAMIANGRQYAKQLTIENWVSDYIKTINIFFD